MTTTKSFRLTEDEKFRIYDLYYIRGMSVSAVAEYMGRAYRTVIRCLENQGVFIRGRKR